MECQKHFKFREDVAQSPLRILRQQTKQAIAIKLDSRKLLLTDARLHRDWRGLAEKADLDTSVIKNSKISYTEHCFHLWIQKAPGTIIRELWSALECIDRYDVIEDTLNLIYNDYDYAMSKDILGLRPIPPPLEEPHLSISAYDSNVLTTDDQKNLKDGGTLQYYDALVLFADEDLDFVDEMVQKLEGEYNLKLCLKDRDLVGGLAFELSAVIRLIEERCARVIVVLSPAFIKSNVNKFFTQFAHALSIDHRRRILIPCMYKPCRKPPEILYSHTLDYFRSSGYWDYWKKLADSIEYKNKEYSLTHEAGSGTSSQSRNLVSLPYTSSTLALPSPASTLPLPSSPSSHSTSSGILSRIRKRTYGGQEHKRKSKIQEISEDSKTPEKIVDITPNLGSRLFISLPDPPVDNEDSVSRSTYSYGSRSPTTPTSPTFSTAPLLQTQTHRDGKLRTMFKKIIKFKKKKELAL